MTDTHKKPTHKRLAAQDLPQGPRPWREGEGPPPVANLYVRAHLKRAIADWFEGEGFVEVETPALQFSPGMEPHLQAFATDLIEPLADPESVRMYLHTSPEFAMKKLLADGMERIFQFARVFRNGERSATHHPEFTMLEWYRAGAGYRDLMADCEALLRSCAAFAMDEGGCFVRGVHRCDPNADWHYLTVAEAFDRHAGIDLFATAPDPSAPEVALLRDDAKRIGVRTQDGDSWEDVFFRIFLERIEPHLGQGAPTVLYDYPVSMAALARPKPGDRDVCERFELYVCGLELANAFGELTDPAEQRHRFESDMAKKHALYGATWPVDEDFIAALEFGLPDCAGIALGFDRLAMLATGAERIEDVLWLPVKRAE